MDLSERINFLYMRIVDEIGLYDDYVSENLEQCIGEYYQLSQRLSEKLKDNMMYNLHQLIDKTKKYTAIYLYSCCIAISCNNEICEEFLQYTIDNKEIGANTRYFIYYQLKSIMFDNICLETRHAKYLKWKLLDTVISEFRQELKDVLVKIPKGERNEKLALVVTEQILGIEHGPTKTALDRSKAFMHSMGKTVLLVNTAEILSARGGVSYFGLYKGSYDASKIMQKSISWKGVEIPFFQCENNMPNIADIRILLQMVQRIMPGIVVSIGGSSVVSNLINDIIPVLTIGLCPSDLEATMTKCQTLGRTLSNEDKELLLRMGMDETSVIESVFTSSLQPQSRKVTRREMGLPEDKFVIAVVGGRLDLDIDQDFAEILKKVARDDVCIACIGKFDRYAQFIKDNPELQICLRSLGFTNEILAWIENCDLYVNPHRKGGGTSSVEALFKGIPVVTTSYGDVAINVGSTFWVKSYDEMPEMILRYKNDSDFYQMMSAKARKRAERLLNTEKEFVRIVEEFRKRCD